MRNRERGFTLIEILVVMAIIATLVGLVAVGIPIAFRSRDKTETRTRLGKIASALQTLRSPQVLGQYPSAVPELLKGPKGEDVGKQIGHPNDTNLGIETVYVACYLQGIDLKLDVSDKGLGNTDGDKMVTNPTQTDSSELYEFVDAWGYPYAYFSSYDYRNYKAVSKYVMKNGQLVTVKPWKDPKTGLYLNAHTFQLFSAGPDHKFNTPDDIGNFTVPQDER